MAENEQQQNEPETPPKRRSLLITILSFVSVGVVCAGLGFAVPFCVPRLVTGGADSQEPKTPKPAFVIFGEKVVNLDDGRLNRYLRVSFSLRVDEDQQKEISELVEARKPILESWLLSHLSGKTMDDVRGEAGQNRVRREIQDYFNAALFDDGFDRIHDILFNEFNIQ